MWISKPLQEALVRIDRLEIDLDQAQTAPDLTPLHDAIASLRASQEVSSTFIDETDDRWNQTSQEIAKLSARLEEMRIAIAIGIENVERAERRIQATVKRARRKLAEDGFVDDGLEAEASNLRDIDGPGGENGGVPPVSEPVGVPEPAFSSVRGVSAEQLRKVRGI